MNAHPARAEHLMTVEDFLDFTETRPDEERWELIDGVPIMITNPTIDHDIIVGNLGFAIESKVRPRSCRVHRSVLVRRTDRNDFGGIPDLMVRCGPVIGTRRTLADAIVVIEVLSPSTMSYDRGDKLRHYLAMQTLRHIALVYQGGMRVELWTRDIEGNWPAEPQILQISSDALALTAVDANVPLSVIYEGSSLATA